MTPERYKKLTDWLEGHPALREGIILLNRWLPLVPFVCYPALLLLLNLRWFAMLRVGRGGGALDFMQVIARAILVPGLAFWMGGAKTPVTAEQAKIWTYNKKENEANLCVLEVQGKNVWLELEGSFNWGKPSVTVRAVRYTFPHIHAALEGLLGTSASDTSIAVSGTQVLTVQCADETRYYRDGQQVERFILKKEDGTQTYVYESEDVVTQEQGVFEKG